MFTLKKDEHFYRTTVTLNNLGSETFTDVYFYDSVDPDNNQQSGGGFATDNTIISQSEMADDSAIVLAEQTMPWLSQVYLKAHGPEWKVGTGGFSNRNGEEIWNGTGAIYGTEGYNNMVDQAICIAHKTETIAPGKSGTTFSYITAFIANTTVDEPVDDASIAELQKAVRLYPNPTIDQTFTIQLEGTFSYVVSDITGKVIQTGTATNNTLVDLGDAEKGIYLIKVTQNAQSTVRKLQLN